MDSQLVLTAYSSAAIPLLCLLYPVGGAAYVLYCPQKVFPISHKPQLRVLYAVDESYCIDASTQKGTVLAIVECSSYGTPPSFGIADNTQGTYAFHNSKRTNTSDGAHVYLIHLVLNSENTYMQQENVIDIGCIITSDCSVVVNATIRFNFCTKPEEMPRPYFLTIPQEWTLQLPISHPTYQYPLFSAFAKVR